MAIKGGKKGLKTLEKERDSEDNDSDDDDDDEDEEEGVEGEGEGKRKKKRRKKGEEEGAWLPEEDGPLRRETKLMIEIRVPVGHKDYKVTHTSILTLIYF